MHKSIDIPFHFLQLRFQGNDHIYQVPLDWSDDLIPDHLLMQRIQEYRTLYENEMDTTGDYRFLLDGLPAVPPTVVDVMVRFAAAPDDISYPAFTLQLAYLQYTTPNGILGLLPQLQIEILAADAEKLEQRMQTAVQRYFHQNERLDRVQNFVNALWLASDGVHTRTLSLSLPTRGKETTRNRLHWLPVVARALRPDRQVYYGASAQIDQLQKLLSDTKPRQIVLVGPRSVGKTTLVREVAYRQRRKKRTIWETTATTLLLHCMDERGWEANLASLCEELKQTRDILFVRNFAELFEVGKALGLPISLADFLRNYLSRSEIGLITECTPEQLGRIEAAHPGYTHLFEQIKLFVPAPDEVQRIVEAKANALAEQQQVAFTSAAIAESIDLLHRFAPAVAFPGDAIQLLEDQLFDVTETDVLLDREEVVRFYCQRTGLPARIIDRREALDETIVRAFFQERLFGQEAAIERVVEMILRIKARLNRTDRPIASFFFVGPTGTGKTEMARLLARFFFGDTNRLVRFDMSEYNTSWSLHRLIEGTNQNSEGHLLQQIRRQPFCVLLLDEIEKADKGFMDLLLQVLQEGRLSSKNGSPVSFSSCVIIMTSNLGAAAVGRRAVGLRRDTPDTDTRFLEEVKRELRPELFNRIDNVVPFRSLLSTEVEAVIRRELSLLQQRSGIATRPVKLQIDKTAVDFLARQSYDARYGARYLQRALRQQVLIPLARVLNEYPADSRLQVTLAATEQQIRFDVEEEDDFTLMIEQELRLRDARLVSELRRSLKKVEHGYAMSRLSDREESQQAAFARKALDRLGKLKARMETVETDLLQQILHTSHVAQVPSQTDEVDALHQEWAAWRTEVAAFLRPDLNECRLGVYGKGIQPALTMYHDLLLHLGLEGKAQWVLKPHHNKTDGPDLLPYTDPENWPDRIPEDEILGVEWQMQAPCIQLLLRAEEGLQNWVDEKNNRHTILVLVQNPEEPRPKDLRASAWRRKYTVRRTVSPHRIQDNSLRLNQEYPRQQLAKTIESKLHEIFEILLDELLQ